jgi:hypothetical protein
VLLKNWPLALLLRHLPRTLGYDAAALFMALLRGQFRPALLARLHLLRELPGLLRKRRTISALRILNINQIEQLLVKGKSP